MNYFFKYYLDAWEKALQFKGLANRKDFWIFILFHVVIYIGFYYLDDFFGTYKIETIVLENRVHHLRLGLFELSYAFFSLLPSIALSVRRLHDIGKSAWFLLLQFIIPPIGQVIFLILMALPSKLDNNPYRHSSNKQNINVNL